MGGQYRWQNNIKKEINDEVQAMFMVHEQGGIHIPHKADRDCQRLKNDSAPLSQLKRLESHLKQK
jgi:hypothetical protein